MVSVPPVLVGAVGDGTSWVGEVPEGTPLPAGAVPVAPDPPGAALGLAPCGLASNVPESIGSTFTSSFSTAATFDSSAVTFSWIPPTD